LLLSSDDLKQSLSIMNLAGIGISFKIAMNFNRTSRLIDQI